MSGPTNSVEATKLLASDLKLLKNKVALLAENKIPVEEVFKDLDIFEQFWAGVVSGFVAEQLARHEKYKDLLASINKLNQKLGDKNGSAK